ncbi:MAG: DUF3551 domain-containing protein [Alcaligenaceae bacterium]|nr:MAG: DUF3551 domain-containing protein [Alcaligenaceae bacterium]
MTDSAILMVILLATGSPIANAAAEPLHDPNLPYCLEAEGGGSQWCGFQTLHQCSESSSGTGRECIENIWIGDERRTSWDLGTSRAVNKAARGSRRLADR